MLRDHELFRVPVPVDLSRSESVNVPDAWKHAIKDDKISVLPLVSDREKKYRDGWCTYTYEHVQAPALEIICGGINAKTPQASAIWRQGHLLHFGFEQSPSEFNDNGRALLVNSVCYIAKFTEDRPIVRPPTHIRPLDRFVVDRLIGNTERDLDTYLDWYFHDKTHELVRGKSREELAKWCLGNRGFVRADERGKFVIDEDARRVGVANDSPEFIPTLIARLGEDSGENGLAQQLLARYVAEGPTTDSSARVWESWWNENQPYLFFSDTGSFRWFVDPLAKSRQIPTKELRGPLRATLK